MICLKLSDSKYVSTGTDMHIYPNVLYAARMFVMATCSVASAANIGIEHVQPHITMAHGIARRADDRR